MALVTDSMSAFDGSSFGCATTTANSGRFSIRSPRHDATGPGAPPLSIPPTSDARAAATESAASAVLGGATAPDAWRPASVGRGDVTRA